MVRGIVIALTVAVSLASALQASASKPVVAVLYFDNNTGDASYDVLQKGFADMVITDLASSDALTVVERDKLQDLLKELKLQRSRFFDKKTAVRIGKGLGARYAVAGSFVAFKPRMRVNARLIEVATGKIVFGTSVVGKPDQIFELEQELVAKFLSGLKLRFDAGGSKKTKVPNLSTAVEYSKGIDLADRGKVKQASAALSKVVSKAPTFALARVRRAELIKSFKGTQRRRVATEHSAREELFRLSDQYLATSIVGRNKAASSKHLGFREIRGTLILLRLIANMSDGRRMKLDRKDRASRRKAQALKVLYYENSLAHMREFKAFRTKFTTVVNGKVVVAWPFQSFSVEEKRRLEQAGLRVPSAHFAADILDQLVRFCFVGELRLGTRKTKSYVYGPPLCLRDKKRGTRLMAILEKELRATDRLIKAGTVNVFQAARLLIAWADTHFVAGDREQGVKMLQKVIDSYPGYAGNAGIERTIESELGLRRSAAHNYREAYAKLIRTRCADPKKINVGVNHRLPEVSRRSGFAGVEAMVRQVESLCAGKPKADHGLQFLFITASREADQHRFCRDAERLLKRAKKYGLRDRSYDSYWRNSKCGKAAAGVKSP